MATLIWSAPMHYLSSGDERAFFAWMQSIPGVISVQGAGHELHIQLKSKRLAEPALREFIALFTRYDGQLSELAQFANAENGHWFLHPDAVWHDAVFGTTVDAALLAGR